MECKKCTQLNEFLKYERFAEANDHASENLIPFSHVYDEDFNEETGINRQISYYDYVCPNCFNLYTGTFLTENDSTKFRMEEYEVYDIQVLHRLSYAFTLFNLAKSMKQYHKETLNDSVDVYFYADDFEANKFLFGNTEETEDGEVLERKGESALSLVQQYGINNPSHKITSQLYTSLDEMLRYLPKNGSLLDKTVFFKTTLSTSEINYDVDFKKFPQTDLLLTPNVRIPTSLIKVIEIHGKEIGYLNDFDYKKYLSEREAGFGNFLVFLAAKARDEYPGEPFYYNSDTKPYFDELSRKYLNKPK